MSFLSRLLDVRPEHRHPVRVRRDLVIPAADGVRLLADRHFPADVERPPLVLLRSPYGRGNALDQLPALLAERGYQVLYQSLRGTAGSGGDFDGFTIDPADADGTLTWLRRQPWFGDRLATWGASYLGYAQWELAAREIPEWKIAVIQDAPAEFAHRFMYPGGAFALGNALGWVQIVDRMFTGGYSTIRQLPAMAGAARKLRRATLTLPLDEADLTLIGHRVPWHLHLGGRLSLEPPGDDSQPSRYRYDPGDPTPTVGGTAVGLSAGRKDNRRIEARPDVLTFTSDPLPRDTDVIGPVRVRLHARSSIPYVDYFARLCDVSPRGRSTNLCDGIVRLGEPGDVRTADIELWPLAHRFVRGHRIRLQVAGGAHPRFGRNPGTGEAPVAARELRPSSHEIFHDPDRSSAIWLPVFSGAS
ncbi:CocE/NonD family hydrolase [Nonomuraea sp. NPDC005650]|uniref:CocE/NonD family hydrolase n=1 Tax=Nonomuraea sp. NPDC005650 TaxID=3157045 RepID=UPI0033ACC4DB